MLNFLRKLRSQNMNTKYFKYAVGEIILVVVGILIALSIGDWNEKRKLDIEEKEYLIRLEKDLAQINDFLSNNQQGKKEWLFTAKTALRYVEGKETGQLAEKALSDILATHANLGTLYIQNATYLEMLNNGAFSRIKNDSLKSAVSLAYKYLEDSNDYITYFRQELSGVTSDIRSMIDMTIIEDMNFDTPGNIFSAAYNLSDLRNSRAFKNALTEVVDTRYDMFTMITSSNNNITDALEKVRNEIKRR